MSTEIELKGNGNIAMFGNLDGYSCLIRDLGYKTKNKKVLYIPVKDKYELLIDKALRVVEGSELHKKLLNNRTKLSTCWIVEE